MSRISLEPIRLHLEAQIFDTWHVSPRALAIYRVAFCAFALLVLVPFSGQHAALSPLHVLLVVSLALVGIGWRTAFFSWLAGICWMLGMGIPSRFGTLEAIWAIAWIPWLLSAWWGQDLSLDARRRAAPPRRMPAWLLAFAAWVLSLMLLTAAIARLCRLPGDPERLEWGALLLAGAFVFALLSPWRFRFVLAVALVFDFATMLATHVPFGMNLIAYGLFAPLTSLAERLERTPRFASALGWLRRRSTRSLIAFALGVAVPLSLVLLGCAEWSRDIRLLSLPLRDWPPSLVVTAGGVVGALVLLGRLRGALRQLRRHPGILIYDADCSFCTRSARWAERHMRSSEIRAWRDVPALLAAHGLTPEDCRSASWWVDDQGRRLRGERAIAKSLVEMDGLRALAGWLIFVPVISWFCAVAYRLIAENRHLMPGGTADCALPAADQASRS